MNQKLNALAKECWEDCNVCPDEDTENDDVFIHHESGHSFNVTEFARRIIDTCIGSFNVEMVGHADAGIEVIEELIRKNIKEKIGV